MSFELESDVDMGRIPPDAIARAIAAADRPDADAVFVSCTALRAAEIVAGAEAAIGKPVVTSIQAMCWQSLRFAGFHAPLAGHGRLLELDA